SRYGKGDGDDYLNLPLDRAQYERFVQDLLQAEYVATQSFEEARFFEGCLPIEVMAGRGPETLRFGCMKPVGLDDPRTGRWPHAVIQLRAENKDRTAYNIVGFQTRMKWGDQRRVFRTIPGLANAEFLRMGSIHRNTYIDSPQLLDDELRLRDHAHVRFAGQITGVEGYVESMACGLLVAWMIAAGRKGQRLTPPSPESTMGALYNHVLGRDRSTASRKAGHVPSNIHWGMCPPFAERIPKKEKKRRFGERAISDFGQWWTIAKQHVGDGAAVVMPTPIRATG
ncbi:MAG: methylenetetrahydrofolate--tRNA-(uracil(54)-C(5))-methyltransferase (FADH(2)-oxidizing) TrmFO, partial [Myxococcota bacterium]